MSFMNKMASDNYNGIKISTVEPDPRTYMTSAPVKIQVKERTSIKVTPKDYGWICPVCGRGNAPWNPTCECKKE